MYVCGMWPPSRRSETWGPSPEEKHSEIHSPPPSPHQSWEAAQPGEESQTAHCFLIYSTTVTMLQRPQSARSDYLLITISDCRTSLFPLVTLYSYNLLWSRDLITIFFSGISHFFHQSPHTSTHTLYLDVPDSRPQMESENWLSLIRTLYTFLKVCIFFLL